MEDFYMEITAIDGETTISVFDKRHEFMATLTGAEFPDTLKHALFIADPLLASWAFGESFLEWTEKHSLERKVDGDSSKD